MLCCHKGTFSKILLPLPIKYEVKLPLEVKPGLLPFRSRSNQRDLEHKQNFMFSTPTLPFKMFDPFWSVWYKMALAKVGVSLQ